jgi:hypothetical protein
MTTYYNIQKPSYKARQEHEKNQCMNLIKQEALQCYQTTMDSYCGGPDTVAQFDDVNIRAQMKALDVLSFAVDKYKLHESQDFIAEINKVKQ